jgi:hypothetical protein
LDEDAAARDASLARLRARWDEAYAPYLADYLTQQHLEYGIAIVSPTLGREGRFFQGDPANSADNIVAVGVAGWETSPDRALSGVVRELCFPVVRRAFAEVEAQFDDRLQAARASPRIGRPSLGGPSRLDPKPLTVPRWTPPSKRS